MDFGYGCFYGVEDVEVVLFCVCWVNFVLYVDFGSVVFLGFGCMLCDFIEV